MSDVNVLCDIGHQWLTGVKLCRVNSWKIRKAKQLMKRLNRALESSGTYVRVKRGFSYEELYVYKEWGGLRTDYGTLLNVFSNDNRCLIWVRDFLEGRIYINNYNFGLDPIQMAAVQCFVVIVCVSEIGRGYTLAPACTLEFLESIKLDRELVGKDHYVNPSSSLQNFISYAPFALSFKNDTEYECDWECDSDSDSDNDWVIDLDNNSIFLC